MCTGLTLPGAVVPIIPHPTLPPPHAGVPPGVPADVDECQEHGAELCGAERCENLPGSYRCVPACQPGYRPRDGGGCEGTGPGGRGRGHRDGDGATGTGMGPRGRGWGHGDGNGGTGMGMGARGWEWGHGNGDGGTGMGMGPRGWGWGHGEAEGTLTCGGPGRGDHALGDSRDIAMGFRGRGISAWGQDGDGQQGPWGDSGASPTGLRFWGTAPRSPPQCHHPPLTPKNVTSPLADEDECAEGGSRCGPHAACHNLPGSFQCACHQGYEAARHGHHCQDVDECATLPGVCGAARCENVDGSFLCLCPDGGHEFDPVTGTCGGPPPSDPPPPAPPGAVEAPPGLAACFSPACGVLAPNVSRQQCCCSVGGSWGVRCPPPRPCPTPGTAEHRALCPHGTGQTTGPQGSAADVDECRVFAPQLCRGGVCINAAPGFSCYCPSGYYYEQEHLQCVGEHPAPPAPRQHPQHPDLSTLSSLLVPWVHPEHPACTQPAP
ncbi:Latent-transforming growth factor beta-binding protein 4-like protein [Aix galericulata]|nr:Latent-transforming growth factor beta-binding protein 4-like protein [Aix galericulata]